MRCSCRLLSNQFSMVEKLKKFCFSSNRIKIMVSSCQLSVRLYLILGLGFFLFCIII